MSVRSPCLRRSWRRRLGCALAAALAPLAGCADAPPKSLGAADFVADAPARAQRVPDEADPIGPPLPVVQLDETVRVARAVAEPGNPALDPDAAPLADASPVLVDELVGEINGKAIFANEFLAGLEGRLRSLPFDFEERAGRPMRPDEWREAARAVIERDLNRFIEDELVTAESYRQLTVPEEGLRRFLEALRANEISIRGGSSAAADRKLQEERGLTTDELLEIKKDEAVFGAYRRQFLTALHVSMRDIKRYYERHYEEFNPPTTVAFRWIRVPKDDADGRERIREGLEQGVPFAQLAHDEANTFRADTGGRREQQIDADLADATLLNDDRLNDPLVALAPGEIAGPIERENDVSWLYLDQVVDVSQSLYDAQVEIERRLTQQEANRRLELKLISLRERAGITQQLIERISGRLLEIAFSRYAPYGG